MQILNIWSVPVEVLRLKTLALVQGDTLDA
jgi:hypothetical protein